MNPPTTMKLEGDVAANWTAWKSKFDNFLKTNNIPSTSDKASALLRIYIGEDALKIYRTLDVDEAQASDLNAILEKLDAHFIGTLTQRRVDFVRCKQASGQSVEEFVEFATKQARQCRWGELEEELVRLIVINGFTDKAATRHLLAQGKGRSLPDAVAFLKTADEVRKMYSDDVQEGAKPKQRARAKKNVKAGEKDPQPPSYSPPSEPAVQPPPYSPPGKPTVQPYSLASYPTEQPFSPATVLGESKASPMPDNRPAPPRYTTRAGRSEEFVYVSTSTPSPQMSSPRTQEQARQRKKKDPDCVIA